MRFCDGACSNAMLVPTAGGIGSPARVAALTSWLRRSVGCRVNPRVVMTADRGRPHDERTGGDREPCDETPRVDVDAEIGVELARQSDRETSRQTPRR